MSKGACAVGPAGLGQTVLVIGALVDGCHHLSSHLLCRLRQMVDQSKTSGN